MKELLQAIKNKWFCCHDWSIINEIQVYEGGDRIGYKYLCKCRKCGKIKIIKTY